MHARKNKTEPIVIWFLVIATISGLLFSLLTVPWQTPDEKQHLTFIGIGIKNDEMADKLFADLDLDASRLYHHSEEKVDVNKLVASLTKKPQYEKQECLPKGVDLSIFDHLPATIGLELGILLGWPTFWTLLCAEIFALLFYIILACFTLKLAPSSHKKLFFMILLMPMCLHQAASINYDSVLLSLCFFFVAAVWHLKVSKKDIGWRVIIAAAVILGVITLIKLPYACIGILAFVIPVDQVCLGFWKKSLRLKKSFWTYFCIILFVIAFGIGVIWAMRSSSYVRILLACATNIRQTCLLLLATVKNYATHLVISFVGNFGWLDTLLPQGLAYIYLTLLVVIAMTAVRDNHSLSMDEELKFSGIDIAIILVFIILLGMMITFSMIQHTVTITLFGVETSAENVNFNEALYQIPAIGGLQGRYYIPLAIPALSILPAIFETDQKKMKILSIAICCIMIIISLVTIYHRYFG